MSETQTYKTVTLSTSENSVVRAALLLAEDLMKKRIDFLEMMGTHTALVRQIEGNLADIQSALLKVFA